MPYDPHKHHRRSIRLKGYDYAQPGAYFITLVSFQRETLFGEIADGKVRQSPLGRIVCDEWIRSSAVRREMCLNEDEFVIMPNHVHGIVWILGVGASGDDDNAPHPDDLVGVDGIRPIDGLRPIPGTIQPNPQPIRRAARSLGSFVAGFKAAVTSRARRELNLSAVWQRNYYEHIIRNEREFKLIWEYIDTNPQRWQEDQLHPSATPNRFNQK